MSLENNRNELEIEKVIADMTHPAEYYDAVADQYDDTFADPIYKAEEMAVMDLVQDEIRGKILDIGCGTGIFLDYHHPSSDYVGMDVSSGMIEKAQKKYPNRKFVVADMQEYVAGLPDQSLDTIFSMFGALSYSLTPREFVAECRRVLQPRGRIVLMPITKRTGEGLYLSETTANGNKIPKITYTAEMARDLFRDFQNVRVMGVNYFGDLTSEMSRKFGMPYDSDRLKEFLVHESKTSVLPMEFARHGIIVGRK